MPQAIVIIEFDEFEGAIITFKYPSDFEIEEKYIQQIQISHNFISSIMVHEYDNNRVNAISHYNEDTLKTIVLFLTKYEDGQTFYGIIEQVNGVLSTPNLSREQFKEEIIRMFDLSMSLIGAREEVMRKLAEDTANTKMQIHDFNNRIGKLLDLSNNTEICILMALCLNDTQKLNDLYKKVKNVSGKKRSTFINALKRLKTRKLIKNKKGVVQINF
ncbi:MAG: hypothetical protein ACTSWY_14385 [Promethearchaeota archaeon]